MNELKKSKLESLRARLGNASLDATKTAAIKGGALLEGSGEPEIYVNIYIKE